MTRALSFSRLDLPAALTRASLVCLFAFLSFADGTSAESAPQPELHVRAGLPHVASRAADKKEIRVAYLGGSITAAAEGWRSLTTDYLRTLYPQSAVTEISAGLPGTGSNLGACRVGLDVLRYHPDLLFVEFAVNDAATPPDRIERTMEGIVRQALRANPELDLCFVYTISLPGLPELEAGRFPPSALAMERVADHYGIPSLHFGIQIAQRVANHQLQFKPATAGASTAPDQESAPPVFSLDGVHPTTAGHHLYAETLQHAWPPLLAVPTGSHAALPPALHADNWEWATLRLMHNVSRTGTWTQVAPDDPNLRGITKALLPPTWRATTAGAALTFDFHGKKFGLLGIGAPDSGQFRVTVDAQPAVTETFFDSYASPTFCRQREWFYPTELTDGPHHVTIEFIGAVPDKLGLKAKAGKAPEDASPYQQNSLTLCGALIIGSQAP